MFNKNLIKPLCSDTDKFTASHVGCLSRGPGHGYEDSIGAVEAGALVETWSMGENQP